MNWFMVCNAFKSVTVHRMKIGHQVMQACRIPAMEVARPVVVSSLALEAFLFLVAIFSFLYNRMMVKLE